MNALSLAALPALGGRSHARASQTAAANAVAVHPLLPTAPTAPAPALASVSRAASALAGSLHWLGLVHQRQQTQQREHERSGSSSEAVPGWWRAAQALHLADASELQARGRLGWGIPLLHC